MARLSYKNTSLCLRRALETSVPLFAQLRPDRWSSASCRRPAPIKPSIYKHR
eukprot:Awhi_evm2s15264